MLRTSERLFSPSRDKGTARERQREREREREKEYINIRIILLLCIPLSSVCGARVHTKTFLFSRGA